MAAVYKAYQPAMDRYVALKILPRHFASDPQFISRFQQEARLLAKLQHPHILPVFDFGETDGYTYIVMPFVESGTLTDIMHGQPLLLEQVQRVISQVGDALDYAMASLKLEDPPLRDRLMGLYLRLDVYPEVKDTLKQLKAGGMKLAILSNGTPRMLAAAAGHSGIADLMDAVLSVEDDKVYKPHPSVYGLAIRRLGLERGQICFLSSDAWDAHAAKAFGVHVDWCNRFGQALERIPERPDGEITSLAA